MDLLFVTREEITDVRNFLLAMRNPNRIPNINEIVMINKAMYRITNMINDYDRNTILAVVEKIDYI